MIWEDRSWWLILWNRSWHAVSFILHKDNRKSKNKSNASSIFFSREILHRYLNIPLFGIDCLLMLLESFSSKLMIVLYTVQRKLVEIVVFASIRANSSMGCIRVYIDSIRLTCIEIHHEIVDQQNNTTQCLTSSSIDHNKWKRTGIDEENVDNHPLRPLNHHNVSHSTKHRRTTS